MKAESSIESLPPGRYAARYLAPLVYERLHERATSLMHGERDGNTLGATGVLNEALLRLGSFDEAKWDSKAHFIGAAYKAMQCVLIDHARGKQALKRGRDRVKVPLDPDLPVAAPMARSAVAEEYEQLFQAIDRLRQEDPESAKIVELWLIGLTNEESAAELGVSLATASRRWKYAKAWLARELPDAGETTRLGKA